MSTSFNLLDEAWIPCLTTKNTTETLSLRQIFTDLRSVRRLACESPVENYAILRVMLVIFWRGHRGDDLLNGMNKRFSHWWETQFERLGHDPDETSLDYLETHSARFDLFGTQPFMQVPDLETPSSNQSKFRLLYPESNSDLFSMRAGDALTTITPAEAARAIIRIQASDHSGNKTGAVGDPRVKDGKGYGIGTGWIGLTGGTVIHGRTLAETLILNSNPEAVFSTEMDVDLPCWERATDTAAERKFPTPTGPCDLLTWQSRRIRLFNDEGSITGVIIANGDKIQDKGLDENRDPMTPMIDAGKADKKRTVTARRPMPYPSTRTLWRSLEPLLVREGVPPSDTTERATQPPSTIRYLSRQRAKLSEVFEKSVVTVELLSLEYGTMNSIVSNMTHLVFDLPLSGLDAANPATARVITAMASQTQKAARHLGAFGGELVEAAGGKWEFNSRIEDSYLDQLQPEFLDWMRHFDRADVREQRMKWNETARRVALKLASAALCSAGPGALIGRVIKTDSSERVLTAGSAYLSLTNRMNKIFPVAGKTQEK